MKLKKLMLPALWCAAILAGAGGVARGANWTWEISNERYLKMNPFERAQYERGAADMRNYQYQLAASEFEKFRAQFPDSSNVSYITFLQGFALENAKQRRTAIKIFNEVSDYFGDDVEVAAPALYWMGMADIENGDVTKGFKAFEKLAEDKNLRKHPLTAGAVRQLADNYWSKKDADTAVKYWKQVITDFKGQNDTEVDSAANTLATYYLREQRMGEFESFFFDDKNRDDVVLHRWVGERAYTSLGNHFGEAWGKYDVATPQQRGDALKAFHAWYGTQRQWWEKSGDMWGFLDRELQFVSWYWGDKDARIAARNEAIAYIKAGKDQGEANQRYSRVADYLRQQGNFDQARECLAAMTDRPFARYKEWQIEQQQQHWKEGEAILLDVEKMGNPYWKNQAMNDRANLYRDQLAQYDKAVALYQQIDQPPGTLWNIQDAYHRWGKTKEALQTLVEIESSFPADAPRAAWYRVSYLNEAKDQKQAIAQARRLMKIYPKSGESVNAHEFLNSLNVASGGGLNDQDQN